MSAVERLERWERRELLVALAVPLGSAGLAYAAWALSERLQWWGPFDRGTFSWAVIIPLWVGGAAVTGWIWSFLADSIRLRVAVAVWLVEAAVVGVTTWLVAVSEWQLCQAGPRSEPAAIVVPAAVIGAITGAMPAISAFLAARAFAGSRPRSAVVVIVSTFVAGVVLFGVAFTWMALGYGGCNRP